MRLKRPTFLNKTKARVEFYPGLNPMQIRKILEESTLQVLLESNPDIFRNVQVVFFDICFQDKNGKEVSLNNFPYCINQDFYYDAVFQVECYCINRLDAAKFLEETKIRGRTWQQ
jgi:hypothetical protein